jgi:hypothetical protein
MSLSSRIFQKGQSSFFYIQLLFPYFRVHFLVLKHHTIVLSPYRNSMPGFCKVEKRKDWAPTTIFAFRHDFGRAANIQYTIVAFGEEEEVCVKKRREGQRD